MELHPLLQIHIKPLTIAAGTLTVTSIDTADSIFKCVLILASIFYVCAQAYYLIKNKGKYKS